jgi:hypothetical protein
MQLKTQDRRPSPPNNSDFPSLFSLYSLAADRTENAASTSSFTVTCWFVAAKMRLPRHCLMMTTSTGCIIPFFSHHVTKFFVLLFRRVRNPTERLLNLISLSTHPSVCIKKFGNRSTEFVWNLILRSVNNICSQIQFWVKIEQRQRTLWRSRPTYVSAYISLHIYHNKKFFECPVLLSRKSYGFGEN